MRRILNIAIVGCGVSGCTAAIYLARQGHRISLLEQSPRVGPVGAGVLLQPSGQRVLRELGLFDAIAAGGERIDELIAHTHRGRLLSRLRYADRSTGKCAMGECAIGIHRGDLFSVLHNALVTHDVVPHLNCRVIGIDRTHATLHDACGQTLGPFDLIIAADGSRSPLRAASALKTYCHEYEPAALWAVGREAAVSHQLAQVTRHTHELCGLLPMGQGRCSFFWGLDRSAWPRVRFGSFEAWRDYVLRLIPQAGSMLEPFSGFHELTFTTYRCIWMPSVVAGRLVFIGDAAHASSPLLGHGINLGMCDARCLAACIAQQATVVDALIAYNARQRLRNAYYAGLSAILTPTFQGRSRWVGPARDLVLPRLQRIAPLRQVMLATLAGVWR